MVTAFRFATTEAVRSVTLIEHRARKRQVLITITVSELITGSPKRLTERPAAAAMLQVIKGIPLSLLSMGEAFYIRSRSEVQQKILS